MPRYSKRSPERESRIITALKAGNTRKAAAVYGGIDEKTFYNWMKDASFSSLVEGAEAECEVAMVATIVKAVRAGDVNAAFRWLERRRPADWGRKYEEFDLPGMVRAMCQDMNLPDPAVAAAVEAAEREVREAGRRSR